MGEEKLDIKTLRLTQKLRPSTLMPLSLRSHTKDIVWQRLTVSNATGEAMWQEWTRVDWHRLHQSETLGKREKWATEGPMGKHVQDSSRT